MYVYVHCCSKNGQPILISDVSNTDKHRVQGEVYKFHVISSTVAHLSNTVFCCCMMISSQRTIMARKARTNRTLDTFDVVDSILNERI